MRIREGNGNAETGSDPGRSGNDERALRSSRVIYPGKKNAFGQEKNRTLRSQEGGMLPHVQNPLLLPPCTISTAEPLYNPLSIIAASFSLLVLFTAPMIYFQLNS